MSRSKQLEIGTLIEYYPGQSNYDIGYVKGFSEENKKTWYHICWFLGKYDTQGIISQCHCGKAVKFTG